MGNIVILFCFVLVLFVCCFLKVLLLQVCCFVFDVQKGI